MAENHDTRIASARQHTPGPWPMEWTGDGKRITIGKGLVDGPNGYEVAEVYSDDCPHEEAEANARLIAAAPDMLEVCLQIDAAAGAASSPDTVSLLVALYRISHLARAAIAKAEGR